MNTSQAIDTSAWRTIYQAAANSAIFKSLHLAASDIDALARQVADRCASKSRRRTRTAKRRRA